jgi:hypothetical protein
MALRCLQNHSYHPHIQHSNRLFTMRPSLNVPTL